MTTTEKTLAEKQAAALETLAAMVREHPEIARDIDYTLNYSILAMTHCNPEVEDQRARVALWARAAMRHKAKVTKDGDDEDFKLLVDLDGVRVKVFAEREQVCEQVGTKTVTRMERDPKAVQAALAEIPEVEVTEEVAIWECTPLLASTKDGGA